MAKEIIRVAVVMNRFYPFFSQVAAGILRYMEENSHWKLIGHPREPIILNDSDMREFEIDGLIGAIGHNRWYESVAENVRCVSISHQLASPPVHAIVNDDAAAGQIAADHLLQRGYTHFAYLGLPYPFYYSTARIQGYCAQLKKAGFDAVALENFELSKLPHMNDEGFKSRIREKLRTLPAGTGVFIVEDDLAHHIYSLALQQGRKVPGELGIIGVNNDEMSGRLLRLPTSSIELNGEVVGFEAAKTLEGLIAGTEDLPKIQYIKPKQLHARYSTDLRRVTDPAIELALNFMEERLGQSISVADVATAAGVSRRVLEVRFRSVFNTTPLGKLTELRMDLAKRLLSSTHHSIHHISELCGYSHTGEFSKRFQATTGELPSAYRRTHSLAD